MCYFQPHCEEDIAVYFYKCAYQKECLQCQVPSREGLYEWDMLAIKTFFLNKKNVFRKLKQYFNKITNKATRLSNYQRSIILPALLLLQEAGLKNWKEKTAEKSA